jgi:hypothetical protein
MRNIALLIVLGMSLAPAVQGQVKWPRPSKLAAVMEQIGITDVSISYGRPAVNGREGKIWGGLVPYGFVDYHYGTSKAAPWRAGANENTTIEFSTAVSVEGKPLAAGKYGFFVAMGPEKATLVFSKDNNAWGSFYYNPANDVLRVDVPVVKAAESVEWLTYAFTAETDSSAVVFKMDYDKSPNNWLTHFGLARGYAGMGDKTTALKYADSGLQLAQDQEAKACVEKFKQALADGKDVSGF